MRQIKFIIALALGLFLMTGCSDSDEPARIDTDFLEELTRGTASTCYELVGTETYLKGPEPTDNWVKQDMSEWDGWQCPGPSQLLIHEGKTCTPLELFQISYGPHPLYFPFEAYLRKTKSKIQFYVTRPFRYDSENNILTIVDGFSESPFKYEVESADENGLTLIYDSQSLCDGNDHYWKWILTYKKLSSNIEELKKNPLFDSNKEAKLAMIKLLRDEFGTSVDMNPYFEGQIVFPGPINLDKVEEWVLAGKDWNPHEEWM